MKRIKIVGNVLLALLALISIVSFKNPASASRGNLKVIVDSYRNSTGQIGFCLFKTSEGFPNHPEKSLALAFTTVNSNSTSYTFTNIEMGTYAVCVFHDENKDKKINSNFLGIPREGVGISNNAKGSFGPPKFNAAKFELHKSEQTIIISLSYL